MHCATTPPPALLSGPSKFSTTVVKRYLPYYPSRMTATEHSYHKTAQCLEQIFTPTILNAPNITEMTTRAISSLPSTVRFANKLVPQSFHNVKYAAFRKNEMDGLMERDVFAFTSHENAASHCAYGSRFVDHLKHEGTLDDYEKTRFVVQQFNAGHGLFTHVLTDQHALLQILLTLLACFPNMDIITNDASKAYVQSETEIRRNIFVRPPSFLGYPPEFLLRVICPLYGMSEAGAY